PCDFPASWVNRLGLPCKPPGEGDGLGGVSPGGVPPGGVPPGGGLPGGVPVGTPGWGAPEGAGGLEEGPEGGVCPPGVEEGEPSWPLQSASVGAGPPHDVVASATVTDSQAARACVQVDASTERA